MAVTNSLWTTSNDGYIPSQQDTSKGDVWLILSKENTTYSRVMPNCEYNCKPKKGDTFVITGITMPEVMIRDAEARLEEKLVRYMREHNEEVFNFSAQFSRVYINAHPELFEQLNENSIVTVNYNGKSHRLYVTSYTCKADDKCLYDVSVELGEEFKARENSLTKMIKASQKLSSKQSALSAKIAKEVSFKTSKAYTDTQISNLSVQTTI
ncbi:MAG: hypothetical protein HUK05_08055 [Prevotella sp.]|nr:hypothetical protein [Prevotella sp.]